MYKKLKIIENTIFIAAVSLGIYALGSTYLKNKDLPPGVCPIDNNRDLIYISIGLLIFSIAFPYIVNMIIKLRGNKS